MKRASKQYYFKDNINYKSNEVQKMPLHYLTIQTQVTNLDRYTGIIILMNVGDGLR